MAKAKKLPSGKWRTQVYDYTETLPDGRKKKHMKSFTADTKKESEYLASQYAFTKKSVPATSMTLQEGIEKYIATYSAVLSSTTIEGYKTIKENAFKSIMSTPISKIDSDIMQRAVNEECQRKSTSRRCKGKPISSKTVVNEYGLVASVIKKYSPGTILVVKLPTPAKVIHDISSPDVIFNIVKGTEIELPVLLAMWLSFTLSEIKGLTKSGSIKGDYIFIDQVTVTVDGKEIDKKIAKNDARNRMLLMPEYIKQLIDKVPTDRLVTISAKAVSNRFTYMLRKNGLPHMSFHDLRHVNASVMAMLNVPDKYAMERGGWKTDKIMKGTYMQTYRAERIAVDQKIDDYFNSFIEESSHESSHKK
nr:MAG TPA: Integrase [Caudoviricetes sp.]